MADSDIIDTIAEWLQANTRYGCSSDRLAQDFLAALRAAGYAVVKLPEPEYGPDGEGQYGWTLTRHASSPLHCWLPPT